MDTCLNILNNVEKLCAKKTQRRATNDRIKSALDAMKMGCSLKNVELEFSINKKTFQRQDGRVKRVCLWVKNLLFLVKNLNETLLHKFRLWNEHYTA